MQHVALVARVGKRHIAKFDVAARARDTARTADAFRRLVHEFEHALTGGYALLQRSADIDQAAQRLRNHQQRSEKAEKIVQPHVVRKHLPHRNVQNTGECE